MKINAGSAGNTIKVSIFYACLLIISFIVQVLNITLPQFVHYLITFAIIFSYTWTFLFITGVLKAANQKVFITGGFVVYLIYGITQSVAGALLPLTANYITYMLPFYRISNIADAVLVIYLVAVALTISNREIKTPVLTFVLLKLFIIIAYFTVPFILNSFGKSYDYGFMKYLSLLYLLLPLATIYLAITALNLLNSQPDGAIGNHNTFVGSD